MDGSDEKAAVIGGNLRVDAATAEVVGALDTAGIGSLLLKGPSIARWLYSAEDPRAYNDCDLLVSPDQVETAGEVLAGLGFTRRFDDRYLPLWWREHSVEWWREDDCVAVDLHRAVPGVEADAHDAWRLLTSMIEKLPVAGHPARALAPPARALHVALHAAQHGVSYAKPMADLRRAVGQLDEPVWRNVVEVADRLKATSGLTIGLRLIPEGHALATRLGLESLPSVAGVLQAGSPPPVALGLDQLARAPGLRLRASIVRRKLVPPPSFMRHWHPMAARGRWGLVRAYLYRPVWIARSAPRALRAWREARAAVGRTR